MNKHFKFILAGAAIVAGLAGAVSCQDLSKDLDDLTSKVNSLESKLTSLESAIKAGDVVTSVTPVAGGIQVTTNNGTYTITNGKDGADGKDGVNGTNGTNGTVWTIGEDGYWYKDGVKTEYKAVGTDGANGTNGTNGTDGTNGTNGKDADIVYYEPNPDTQCFDKVTIKPDGTKTVEKTDIPFVASGDGTITAVYDKEKGTLTIFGVEGYETGYVIPTTSGLKSLAYAPKTIWHGEGLINFYSIYTEGATAGTFDKFVIANQPKATYRVNPTNADVTGFVFSFINRDIKTKVDGDKTDLISIVEKSDVKDGGITFTLKANKAIKELPKTFQDHVEYNDAGSYYYWADGTYSSNASVDMVLLQAQNGDEVVISDDAVLNQEKLTRFRIIDHDVFDAYELPLWFYDRYFIGVDASNKLNKPIVNRDYDVWMTYNAAGDNKRFIRDLELVYNDEKGINIIDSLYTYATEVENVLEKMEFDPYYKVTLVGEYLGTDNATNQNKFVTLDSKGQMVVDTRLGGESAIGRRPLVLAESFIKDSEGKEVKLAEAYVRVRIVDGRQLLPEREIQIDTTILYNKIPNVAAGVSTPGTEISLNWWTINDKIFEELGVSYRQFANNYWANYSDIRFYDSLGNIIETVNKDEAYVDYDLSTDTWRPAFLDRAVWDSDFSGLDVYNTAGTKLIGTTKGIENFNIAVWNGNTDINTNLVEFYITDQINETISGTVRVKFSSNDPYTYPAFYVNFKYEIKYQDFWPEFNANNKVTPLSDLSKAINGGAPYDSKLTAEVSASKIDKAIVVKGKLDDATDTWIFSSTIKEHFQNYLRTFNEAYYGDGTTAHPANNQNHYPLEFALEPVKAANGTIGQTGASFKTAGANTGTAASQIVWTDEEDDIKLDNPLEGNFKDYVMTIRHQLDNGNYKYYKYIVRFVNPFEIVLPSITLRTYPVDPDKFDLVKAIKIVERGTDRVVFQNGNVTALGVAYKLGTGSGTSADPYVNTKIDVANIDVKLPTKDDINEIFETEVAGTTKKTLDWVYPEVIWNNYGAVLQQDRTAKYDVAVTITGISKVSGKEKITILSSEHSR